MTTKESKGTVIICPGGGYSWLSGRESEPIKKAFEEHSWRGEVLNYEVGCDLGTRPLKQLGEKVSEVRKENPHKPVVVCGFSAGGHLAASIGVHYKDLGLERPDALILSYPVITTGEYAHKGSIRNLGGDDTGYFSLEKHVTPDTPPTFIWATATDEDVPVENSLMFAAALSKAKVPFEMHIWPYGAHGLSLATPEVDEPEKGRYADEHIAKWFMLCIEWLDKIF